MVERRLPIFAASVIPRQANPGAETPGNRPSSSLHEIYFCHLLNDVFPILIPAPPVQKKSCSSLLYIYLSLEFLFLSPSLRFGSACLRAYRDKKSDSLVFFLSLLSSSMFPPAMSNSTSLSEEASVSSGTKLHHVPGFNCALTAISPQQQQQQKIKKKRNLPGNPDPDAEVIALSPKSLMATNRFVCEICNKGFQRDQNLQLHRRGHNLPWKLRQRNSNEMMRKRVYVCPEPSCVHHHPSRALGDLTGIKKHFCRKHGEKKWKCDKCSKKYAVQSDWKAHVKTCGTREYRCDCGTLFSRKDSFVTHRAFCDALAEESARLCSTPLPIRTPLASTAAAAANSAVITRYSEPPALLHLTQNPSSPLLPPVFYRAPSNSPLSLAWDTQSSPLIKSEGTHFDPAFINRFNAQNQPPTSAPPLSATALLQKAATMGAVSGQAAPSSLGVHMSALAGGRISPTCLTIEGQNLDAWRKGKDGMTRDFLGLAEGESASDHVCVRELLSFTGMGISLDSFSYERGPPMKAPIFGFQTQAWTDC